MSKAPTITAQESIPQVFNDIGSGTLSTDRFWISWNEKYTCDFEVCLADGQLEVRSLGDLEIALPNSKPGNCTTCPVNSPIPYIDVSNPSTSYVYRMWFSTNDFARLQTWYDATTHNVTCLDCTADKLLFGDSEGGLYVVSVLEGGALRQSLEGHFSATTKCKILPSGTVAISYGSDFQVKIWDLSGDTRNKTAAVRNLAHPSQIVDLDIVGRGRNVVTAAADNVVRLWEVGSGSVVHQFKMQSPICAIAVLGNHEKDTETTNHQGLEFFGNKHLAVAMPGEIVVIDLQTKQTITTIPTPYTTCLAEWNSILVSGNKAGQIQCWNLQTGALEQGSLTVEGGQPITHLSAHDNNKLAVLTPLQALSLCMGELAHSYLVTDNAVKLTAVATTSASVYVGGKAGYLRHFIV